MSTKTVVVWLIVAVVLGGAALLLLNRSGIGPAPRQRAIRTGEQVVPFDPSRVVRLRVEHPDGIVETIERDGADWALRVRTPSGPATDEAPAWPLMPARVQGLLRHLAQMQAVAEASADAQIGPSPTVVTLDLADGGSIVLRLSDRLIAGIGTVEVRRSGDGEESEPRVASVSHDLHNVFRNPGAREWRERQALRGLSEDVSRLRITNTQNPERPLTLALAKVSGQWALREPIAAPADPAAVRRLLNTLANVQIADFLDTGTAGASTGLENPSVVVTVETDRREMRPGQEEPTQSVERRELRLGKLGDAQLPRVFASIDGRTVLVDARNLTQVRLRPGEYVWPYPTRLAPADVGTIVIERHTADAGLPGRVFRRTLDRWTQISDAGETLLADADLRRVASLVDFLSGGTADAAAAAPVPEVTFEAPEGYRPVGRVALLSLGEAPLETLEVGVTRPGTLTIRTGDVYRTYTPDRVPALLNEVVAPSLPSPPEESADPDAPTPPSK